MRTRRGSPPWYTRTWIYALWDWTRTRLWLLAHPEERRLRAHTQATGMSRQRFIHKLASDRGLSTQDIKRAGVEVGICTCGEPHCLGWRVVE